MQIPPGGGPAPHRHDFEETFSVLEGEVVVTFRGKCGRMERVNQVVARRLQSLRRSSLEPMRTSTGRRPNAALRGWATLERTVGAKAVLIMSGSPWNVAVCSQDTAAASVRRPVCVLWVMVSKQRCVLVIGGAGGVGSGIVEALLEQGAFDRVLASSRDAVKLDRLRAGVGDRSLTCILGNVDDRAAADALLAEAQRHGALCAVAACLGGWWEGPLLTELDACEWDRVLASLLRPHFVAARTFVPALTNANARYLLIGGDAALGPAPHSALVSIAGAAQIMLVRALAAERRDEPFPIVEELIISGAVRTREAHHGPITEGEITAREAGDVAAAMLHDGTTGDWPHITRDGPLVRMHAKGKPLR